MGPPGILIVHAAALVVVVVLGSIQMAQAPIDEDGARPVGTFAAFALDSETNPVSAFAALQLVFAAVLAWALAVLRAGLPRWALVATGLLFGFMAADEWAAIHEEADSRLDTTWQLVYLPLLLAAVPWLALARGLGRHRGAAGAWLAAGTLWFAAVALNVVVPTDDREESASYKPLVVIEEALELTGSFLFGGALLIALAAHLGHGLEQDREDTNAAGEGAR